MEHRVKCELLKLTEEKNFLYYRDIKRLYDVLTKEGLDISFKDAEEIWEANSNRKDASWLSLPESDDDIIEDLSEFAKELALQIHNES